LENQLPYIVTRAGEKVKGKRKSFEKSELFSKNILTKGAERDIIIDANRKGKQAPRVCNAGVAEQADARDLKSRDARASYRFDPGHRHHRVGSEKQNIAG
jgi:hypothetical protein